MTDQCCNIMKLANQENPTVRDLKYTISKTKKKPYALHRGHKIHITNYQYNTNYQLLSTVSILNCDSAVNKFTHLFIVTSMYI